MPLAKEKMMTKEIARNSRNSDGVESIFGWDPFSAMFSRRPVDRFLSGFPFTGLSDALESDFGVGVVDNGDSKQFKYPLPGVSKDNITVEIVDNVLFVQVRETSENGQRSYSSKVTLDQNLDLDSVTADSKDGLLVVSIPIKEQTSRRIPISIGEDHESIDAASLEESRSKRFDTKKDQSTSESEHEDRQLVPTG
jgi:HSP20 family molecular chaperone IbpA